MARKEQVLGFLLLIVFSGLELSPLLIGITGIQAFYFIAVVYLTIAILRSIMPTPTEMSTENDEEDGSNKV